ncbi:sigma factor-like helix-turn-helix DNA-binding protein [Rhodococcus wratislaviensis]|uniref:RNA polymerase sigma factor 70 region 4 type 2 domain-containing protein n=1 Tax=Rhodococcus wratislaviensis NBRC 100605 TaxID=1219028 RepID=X0QY93_RHOWR|nr:hypothetical protein RW1_008_00080 [Rhodococcus wratislaviensis NBRC 100605]
MDSHEETRTQWLALVAALPDHYQDVLRLRLVYRLSVQETAEIMHTSPDDILVTQHTALNVLREHLAKARIHRNTPTSSTRAESDVSIDHANATPLLVRLNCTLRLPH